MIALEDDDHALTPVGRFDSADVSDDLGTPQRSGRIEDDSVCAGDSHPKLIPRHARRCGNVVTRVEGRSLRPVSISDVAIGSDHPLPEFRNPRSSVGEPLNQLFRGRVGFCERICGDHRRTHAIGLGIDVQSIKWLDSYHSTQLTYGARTRDSGTARAQLSGEAYQHDKAMKINDRPGRLEQLDGLPSRPPTGTGRSRTQRDAEIAAPAPNDGPGVLRRTPAAWCARGDLNPHVRRHWNLNPARLPIPPLAQDAPGGAGRTVTATTLPVAF